MIDKEQLEEVTKIINKRCEAELGQVHANNKDGKVTKTVDTSLIAKDIINANYHRTVWHKIADGDLPEHIGPYLIVYKDESVPEYDVDFYENFWDGKRWVYNEGRVIAWTELPLYEE